MLGYLLRSELSNLLGRVTKLKHGESEIEFGKLIAEARSDEEAELQEGKELSSPGLDRLIKLAEQTPRGAILDAWLQVEEELNNYARSVPIGIEPTNNAIDLIHQLEWVGMEVPGVGRGVLRMAGKLCRLRNEAVHLGDREITAEDAVEYIHLAERVKNRLEEA